MATDALSNHMMMCMALWATKHKIEDCVQGETLDDCPLEEIVTCKHNDEDTCDIDGLDDYFCCANGKRKE